MYNFSIRLFAIAYFGVLALVLLLASCGGSIEDPPCIIGTSQLGSCSVQ